MTPADIMRAQDDGYNALKFFPASQAGGTALLKGFSGPFTDTVFCPTGGINADNAKDYLNLPNVLCVGGSWVAPGSLIERQDWQGITKLAAACQSF
jgi:2-dehydro-3-deoxyphosphogluconate aldolase/(4S)-4-hydroxy-2-oxoglutarate aldolase